LAEHPALQKLREHRCSLVWISRTAARPTPTQATRAPARRYSPTTSRHSSIRAASLLAPFAMYTPFACSDYYEASAPPDGHQPATSLPAPTLDGPPGGRPRVVPTFTMDRSTTEMPSLNPDRFATSTPQSFLVASPPAYCSGFGVTRHMFRAGAHGIPTHIHQVRVGSTLTEPHALVPLVHLLVSPEAIGGRRAFPQRPAWLAGYGREPQASSHVHHEPLNR